MLKVLKRVRWCVALLGCLLFINGVVAQEAMSEFACEPTYYALPGEFVVPESITYEASSNSFFIGSAADGTIFRAVVGEAESVDVFSPAGADGRIGALGMEVDDKGRLFVAGSRTGQIFVYDTASAELIASFDTIGATGVTANENGFPHNLTDIVITPDGDVFVTDAFLPYLYRVFERGGQLEMEVFIDFTDTVVEYQTPVGFAAIRSMEDNVANFNINAIEVTPNGDYLILGQTNVGKLFRLALADRSIEVIHLGGMELRADDLLLDGDLLYINTIVDMTPNAANPTAIVIAHMSDDFTSGEVLEIYVDDRFNFQTSFVFVGDCLLATNSQLPGFFTRQFALPFTVVSIPIPKPAR